MSSTIKQRLQEDMKAAMRAKEQERLTLIRFVLAAIKRQEIDSQIELDDAGVLEVLEKMAKQHTDSITQYRNANRSDLADKEQRELDIIETYMPKSLSEEEMLLLIRGAIEATGATSMRDMGKVVAAVKERAQGRLDMRLVSALVKQLLA